MRVHGCVLRLPNCFSFFFLGVWHPTPFILDWISAHFWAFLFRQPPHSFSRDRDSRSLRDWQKCGTTFPFCLLFYFWFPVSKQLVSSYDEPPLCLDQYFIHLPFAASDVTSCIVLIDVCCKGPFYLDLYVCNSRQMKPTSEPIQSIICQLVHRHRSIHAD